MRAWLKQHECPAWGTKQELYAIILVRYKLVLHEEAVEAELQRRLERAREGQPQMPAVPLKTPKMPTDAERAEHELTHAKFMPWREACVLGKGAATSHDQVTLEDREPAGPRIEFDFAHMKSDGSFYEDGEEFEYSNVFCTHLVGVDMGNEKFSARPWTSAAPRTRTSPSTTSNVLWHG